MINHFIKKMFCVIISVSFNVRSKVTLRLSYKSEIKVLNVSYFSLVIDDFSIFGKSY